MTTGGKAPNILIIACGALAREILDIQHKNGLSNIRLLCLPANLHNRPQLIPQRLREKIREHKPNYTKIFVAYGDCGTGGGIDKVLAEEGAERIGGPHCYAFYAGQQAFEALAEEEIGSYYLTDYLVRHFDTLVMDGLGLNKHPELRDMIFGHYKRLVYLAQTDDAELDAAAQRAAARLQLAYVKVRTGFGELADFIADAATDGGPAAAEKPPL